MTYNKTDIYNYLQRTPLSNSCMSNKYDILTPMANTQLVQFLLNLNYRNTSNTHIFMNDQV